MKDDAEALAGVLDGIQACYRDRIAGGISTLDRCPEGWGFVGAPMMHVLAQLRVALGGLTVRSPRFLECGSGFGFVAALARELGFNVTGIEIEPSYIETSRKLFPSVRVVEADLTVFDRFGDFDVVYYYGPFADDEVQARFERRIEDALRPGSIILASRKVTFDFRTNDRFEVLATTSPSEFVLKKR